LRKTVVRRDVKFEEDRALRKAHDTGAATTRDQELETQKTEDTQVTGAGTGTGAGKMIRLQIRMRSKEAPPVQDTLLLLGGGRPDGQSRP
jgi:hypothetical protein